MVWLVSFRDDSSIGYAISAWISSPDSEDQSIFPATIFSRSVPLIVGEFRVVLMCYMDETGTHDAAGLQPGAAWSGIAGWIARESEWDAFSLAWQKVLEDFKIPAFHFRELIYGGKIDSSWPYGGWSRVKVDEFIRSLIRTVRENTLAGFGCFVDVQAYERIVLELSGSNSLIHTTGHSE